MRSKGSVGVELCSLDVAQPSATVRSRSQLSATVRNRSREVALAVRMGSSAKGLSFGGFPRGIASFRVAGVALCDIPTCFMTCRTWFCVAGAILLRRFQKMICSFRGRRSTVETSDVILRGRRSTLDVSCSPFFANRIVRAASSGGTQHSAIYTPHFTPYTLHFTLHTLHSTLCTLHSTLCTLHSTLYTPHCDAHFTLYTLHSTLSTSDSILNTLHFTLHTFHFTLYTPHFTLYTTLYT